MRTTGQRLDEHQAAIQRMLDWWGDLLPALQSLEHRVNGLAEHADDPRFAEEVHAISDLLAKIRAQVPKPPPE